MNEYTFFILKDKYLAVTANSLKEAKLKLMEVMFERGAITSESVEEVNK